MKLNIQELETRVPCRRERPGLSGLTRALLLLPILALAGCASMGPDAVPRDRFNYTTGLQPVAVQAQPPKPSLPENHYEAARAALMGGDRAKALREVKLALQDNPLDAASHFLLACLLERKGESDQAIVGFQQVSALDPASPAALYNLGTMLLTVTGWTSGPKERAMLDRILGKDRPPVPPVPLAPPMPQPPPPPPPPQSSAVLDLTSDDTGDPQRMLEIDAVLFVVNGLVDQNLGFNFLKQINITFNYFATNHDRQGTGFVAPRAIGAVLTGLQSGWIFGAAADYVVNIANALNEQVAVLARPHLTALSGTSAKFLAGGELVFKVTGNIGGDIKPYPFGTTLMVTPTLLRMPAEDGTPRVHLAVEAGRTSVLALLNADPDQPTSFTKVTVASQAVLAVGQTLILSGLSQRESRRGRSGVPILRDIPILKYFFSTEVLLQSDAAVIILLTPRDAAFWDERSRRATAEFVDMRRAFIRARRGTEEDMRRFRERYPDWDKIPPNRFGSHLFLAETSEMYRSVSGQDLTSDDIDLELLGPK